MRQLLRDFEERRKYFQHPEIKYVYADNCCQMRNMLQQEIPSLQRNIATPSLLPLPDDSRIRILSTSEVESLAIALDRVLKHVRNLREGQFLPLGLDVEWNVDHMMRKVGKVPLVQIATSERLLGDKHPTGLVNAWTIRFNLFRPSAPYTTGSHRKHFTTMLG